MRETSSKLLKLRPVTFRYNNDPAGSLQYGLVAEEVEKVYPDLVTYGADGKVETVRYSMLTSMLLNELQKQAVTIKAQDRENRQQAEKVDEQAEHLRQLSVQLAEAKAAALEQASELKALRSSVAQRFTELEQAMVAQDTNQPRASVRAYPRPLVVNVTDAATHRAGMVGHE